MVKRGELPPPQKKHPHVVRAGVGATLSRSITTWARHDRFAVCQQRRKSSTFSQMEKTRRLDSVGDQRARLIQSTG
jgi:hypothetical protein